MRSWINLVTEAAWDTENWWEPKKPDHPLYTAHDGLGDEHPEGDFARFRVPAEVANRYSYGQCIFLAYAMNERFGWTITVGFYDTDEDSDIAHAWCDLPDGRIIDILGPQDEPDTFGAAVVRKISPEELWEKHIMRSEHGDIEKINDHLDDARKAVDLFIAPKVTP